MLQVEICIQGRIDQGWSEWLEGLQISYLDEDRVLLSGVIADQTALYSLIARLYRLGLPLLSVTTNPVIQELNN